jgi:hypothetical protein
MKRLSVISVLLTVSAVALGQASAVDTKPRGSLLSGKWKADIAKSQLHPNHQFKSLSMHFVISEATVRLTFNGVNMSGQEESGSTEFHPDGKDYPVAQAPDIVQTSRWIGSNSLETVARRDGKVIGEGSYEVSADGKTLTARVKGIDASGSLFEQVIVFDRES